MNFITGYVKQAPDIMDSVYSAAASVGLLAQFQPIFDTVFNYWGEQYDVFENRELTVAFKKEGAMGPIPGVALETRRFPQEDILNKEIIAFVEAIKTGQEPRISGEAGRAALNLALDIMAAMKVAKG